MVALLLDDMSRRHGVDPILWAIAPDADARLRAGLSAKLNGGCPAFRQSWLLAEAGGVIVGLSHSILLPVPPIYAGEFGPPGLIMEDCHVSDTAPDGTAQALLDAAEHDLIAAGAQILLASSIAGGAWQPLYARNRYVALTEYFSKTGLSGGANPAHVRVAQSGDVPGIVASSARNRQVLHALDPFWKPHGDADTRFGAWMGKSLTLPDRDMFVSQVDGALSGYAISQPATPLHFPASHDISRTGVIDDYFHIDFADPARLSLSDGLALFQAAEAALQARGGHACLVVCPSAWGSKIDLLRRAGYAPALRWFIKR